MKTYWKCLVVLSSLVFVMILYHFRAGIENVHFHGLNLLSGPQSDTNVIELLSQRGTINTHESNNGSSTISDASVKKKLKRNHFYSTLKGDGKQQLSESLHITHSYHNATIQYRRSFNCAAILNGSKSEVQKVRNFYQVDRPEGGYLLTKPEVLSSMFLDCAAYKKIRGHVQSEGSPEERDFPIAFVILAHQDFDHLERLLRLLYRPQHVYCVHLDKEVPDELLKAVTGLVSCFPNVMLASDPQNVTYASMSRLMADYVCMKDLVRRNDSWKFLINTAATSLPLQTNREIVRHLKYFKGKNDMNMRFEHRMPRRWAVEYYITDKGVMRSNKKPMPPPPHNLTVTKGLAYNSFSREFLDWVMKDPVALDFLEWCEKTYSPDEHYWATLNNLYHNTHLKTPGGFTGHPDTYHDSTLLFRYVGQGQSCGGRKVHNFCLFGSEDLSDVRTRPWCMMGSKFDLLYEPVAYSCMEELVENKTRAGSLEFEYQDGMVLGACVNIA